MYFHPQLECDPGWFQVGAYGCYALKDSKKTWDQWKQGCGQENATLLTLETEAEYEAIELYLKANKGEFSQCHEWSLGVSKIKLNNSSWSHRCTYLALPYSRDAVQTLYFILHINTLRPRQDGHHFADDSFTCIFFNENCCILIKFSLKYVCKGPIDNNRALVQIMAWRRSGDKPLSEPMMISISLPTHICVTRPQVHFIIFNQS